MPFIFTRSTLFSSLDFSATGQIGDTIGGITAPFMGLVGSILVFLSFKAQTDMNRKQFEAIDKQFKRMEEEKKREKYEQMQHVVNIINNQYIEDYKNFMFGIDNKNIVQCLNSAKNYGFLSINSEGEKALNLVNYRLNNLDALLQ